MTPGVSERESASRCVRLCLFFCMSVFALMTTEQRVAAGEECDIQHRGLDLSAELSAVHSNAPTAAGRS